MALDREVDEVDVPLSAIVKMLHKVNTPPHEDVASGRAAVRQATSEWGRAFRARIHRVRRGLRLLHFRAGLGPR